MAMATVSTPNLESTELPSGTGLQTPQPLLALCSEVRLARSRCPASIAMALQPFLSLN